MAKISESRPDGSLNIQVGVDCNEAITGFKALQREIKETVKSVKELESTLSTLSAGGINIKGGKIDTKEPSRYKGIQHARYLIIDFDDSHTDNFELEIKGHEKISKMWFQDSI